MTSVTAAGPSAAQPEFTLVSCLRIIYASLRTKRSRKRGLLEP